MSTEDNIAIAAVRREFTDALAEVPPRMPLSVPCAMVGWREHMPPSKGTQVTTNMNFVRRSSSPFEQWETLQNAGSPASAIARP
jgi:hypothetical protein